LKYLEAETKVKFKQVFAKDFDEHIKLCREGKISIAYSNPVTYAQMAPKGKERKQGHIAFGVANTAKGARDFYGQFIIRHDNSVIKRFADIKGKKGWIVGWQSAGGYIFQQAYALDNGIDLPKDCTITESPDNKQEKVIMAVYNLETDFGCIRNGMLETVKDRIDLNQIKILAETPRHPAWVLSIYNKINSKQIEKIKNAFLKMPKELVAASELPGKVENFIAAADSDFDPIRQVLDKVKTEY
jgi:phosphonate transport system substrate-binding protein